jgi:hypothetical protein
LGAADGLKYYDLVEGKGPIAEKGSTVQVTDHLFTLPVPNTSLTESNGYLLNS